MSGSTYGCSINARKSLPQNASRSAVPKRAVMCACARSVLMPRAIEIALRDQHLIFRGDELVLQEEIDAFIKRDVE